MILNDNLTNGYSVFAATVRWQVKEGDQGPHTIQADSNQGQGHPSRVVSSRSRLHQSGK